MMKTAPTQRFALVLAALVATAAAAFGPPREDGEFYPPAAGEAGVESTPEGPERPAEAEAPALERVVFGRVGRPNLPEVAPDHIVVQFREDLPLWQRRQVAAAAGGTTFKVAASGSFAKVGLAAGDTPHALATRLSRLPGILLAEPDPYAWGLLDHVALADTPTDPFVPQQWSLARIRLPEARDKNRTEGNGVIVAVLDSGVAAGSAAAFPDRRGIDLEATRFLPGLDTVDGGPPFDLGVNPGGGPVRFGHGTFVAAQIAAAVNNGLAGAGIAPRVTILPVRVIGLNNFALFSDLAEGIDFAVAQGAKVINMSLGGTGDSSLLRAAVERAHRAGVVIVASAGNTADQPNRPPDVLFPARYPEVIAVGATGFNDQRAPYSDFGAGLDLMAPAGASAATVLGNGGRDAALAPSFVHDSRTGQTTYAGFFATGTSFAAPQVSGAAALLIALGVRDPEAVRALLEQHARELRERGRDDQTGHGLLDIAEAHRGLGFAF